MTAFGAGARVWLAMIVVGVFLLVNGVHLAHAQYDDITLTFRLTLYGTPPAGDSFQVIWYNSAINTGEQEFEIFCNSGAIGSPRNPRPSCEGAGAMYEKVIPWSAGYPVNFRFVRIDPPGAVILEGDRVINEDTIISAYYDYRTGEGGEGDGPQAPEVPNTGAGGTAGRSPVGTIAGVVILLPAAWCAATRRR